LKEAERGELKNERRRLVAKKVPVSSREMLKNE
jgi:hypothetical protein